MRTLRNGLLTMVCSCTALLAHSATLAAEPEGTIPSRSHVSGAAPAGMAEVDLRRLMRPRFKLGTTWYETVDAIGLSQHELKMSIPTYPVFGPPPPIVSLGYAFTALDAPPVMDLPDELHSPSLSVAWMRRWSERWMFRSMIGVAFATDGKNESSDAWQFRGGLFAIYRPSEVWTWTFGAIALGRNDIPVVPAVGLIYQPHAGLRYDLMFPKPRISWLLADAGTRQQWAYFGGGLNGGTWAYQDAVGGDDQITYRDWQCVLGWESTPRRSPGMPFVTGRAIQAEIGYAFGRKFEFERGRADQDIGNAIVFQAGLQF